MPFATVGVLQVVSDESLCCGVPVPVQEKPIDPPVHITVMSCVHVADWLYGMQQKSILPPFIVGALQTSEVSLWSGVPLPVQENPVPSWQPVTEVSTLHVLTVFQVTQQ